MSRVLKKILDIPYRKKHLIISIAPCYEIIDSLSSKSIMVDIGLGEDANFSQALIAKYHLTSFGFDPTEKHIFSLRNVAKGSNGHFTFYPKAVAAKRGERVFYESQENTSGSFLKDHTNMMRDRMRSYTIEAISIEDIFSLISHPAIDIVKIDVEGEEYAIIPSLTEEVLCRIGQFVIEFHHHCIKGVSLSDTLDCIKFLERQGFGSYSLDAINYLFFRK